VKSIEYFSDSMAVLGWIMSTEKRKEDYVNSRLKKIHLNTNRDQWFYCPTHANPAENTTRYQHPFDLNNKKLWWNRPSKNVILKFRQKEPTVSTINQISTNDETIITKILKRRSSLQSAIDILEYLLKIKDKIKGNNTDNYYEECIQLIIRDEQQTKEFQELLKKFEKENGKIGRQIKQTNEIYTCHGRIQQTDQQILLHPESRFLELLRKEEHMKMGHPPNTTLMAHI
jgi:hypothetical protein